MAKAHRAGFRKGESVPQELTNELIVTWLAESKLPLTCMEGL